MKIKLLKTWSWAGKEYLPGIVLEVDSATAEELVKAGTAELYDAEAEAKALAAEEAAAKAREAEIAEAVRKQLAEAQKASIIPGLAGAQTHERVTDDPKGGWKTFGEMALAVKNAKIGKGVDERLVKASGFAQESIDSEGGFLVPEEFRATLLRKTYETGQIISRCFNVPMGSNVVKIPTVSEASRADGSRHGGARGYWTAETAAKTPSQPAFGEITLSLKKLAVLIHVSDELIEDSAISMSSILTEIVSDELQYLLEESIVQGTGAGMPLGVMSAPCLVTVAKEAAQVANTIVAENVNNMWQRMWAPSRANACWLINQDAEGQLDLMGIPMGATYAPVYLPAGGWSGQPFGTLKGRPVIPCEHCATLGSLGDIILCDFNSYLLGQKAAGIAMATSIHFQFDHDTTAFRFVLRADGQPWWSSALTPKRSTATLSPFVALAVRA